MTFSDWAASLLTAFSTFFTSLGITFSSFFSSLTGAFFSSFTATFFASPLSEALKIFVINGLTNFLLSYFSGFSFSFSAFLLSFASLRLSLNLSFLAANFSFCSSVSSFISFYINKSSADSSGQLQLSQLIQSESGQIKQRSKLR